MAKEQGVFLDIRILSFLRHWTFVILFFEIFIRVYRRDSRASLRVATGSFALALAGGVL